MTRSSSPRGANELLRQSEESMSLLVESVKDYAIFMLDPHGCITSWNGGAQRIKGYTAQEAIGAHFSQFYPAEAIAARHPEHELDVAAREGRYEEEGWRIRKDGQRFWANVVITAIHDPVTGVLRGFAKVTRDLTERRRMEAEALRERLRAEETVRALQQRDEFLAAAAHELRTPLSALVLKLQGATHSLERARRGGHDLEPDKLAERLDGALRQVERMTELVERLLEVSRLVQGKLPLELQPTSLGEVAARVVEGHRELARRMGTELRLRIAGDPVGTWDRARLERAVASLLSNAIKYGRSRPIELEVEATEASARLSVIDQGIGIAAEDLERIFTRFERAAPLRHYAGLGLGLYVARSIVEAHGGTIRMSSQPDQGTTVMIELPRPPRAEARP